MLEKLFRALSRYWESNGIEERPLISSDYKFLLDCLWLQLLRKNNADSVPTFCSIYLVLHRSLEDGRFDSAGAVEEVPQETAGKRKKSTKIPTISPDRNLNWLNAGLTSAFSEFDFITMFFDNVAELVFAHAVSIPSTFSGDEPIIIPTDDSITAAMATLPPGYREVLMSLQFNIWKETCMHLFYYCVENVRDLGGPGTSLRLVIDMVESQLFNRSAVQQNNVLTAIAMKDGSSVPIASLITTCVTSMLGAFPVNLSLGPLLKHIFYVTSSNQDYSFVNDFIAHCCNETEGLAGGHRVHRMGLLTVLGCFILGSDAGPLVTRQDDILCRSQIELEHVWRVIPQETIKRVFDCITDCEDWDDFVIIALSYGAPLIRQHGAGLMAAEDLQRLRAMLVENDEDLRQLLDDADFEKLLAAVNEVVAVPTTLENV